MAKLITESLNTNYKTFIEEDVHTGEKKYYITGSFLKTDIRNQNGRLYPMDVVKPCINEFVEKKVKLNRAVGELNHPHKPEIDLERIAIIIEELYFEGNDVIGKARVVHDRVKELIDAGLSFGVSLRALGDVDDDGIMLPGMTLLAIDLVADPSFETAFVDPILESREYEIKEDGSIVCVDGVCSINKTVEESKNNITECDVVKTFNKLINTL